MFYSRQDFAFGCSITSELIGDNHTRNVLEPFKELAEKAFGGFLVASALHKNVQDIAVLVHGSPQVMSLATDREGIVNLHFYLDELSPLNPHLRAFRERPFRQILG